jgi:hypothetical protein
VFHELLALAESRGGMLVARAGVIEPLDRRSGSKFDPAVKVADLADADKATAMRSRPSSPIAFPLETTHRSPAALAALRPLTMRAHGVDTHRTDQHDRQVPAGGRESRCCG